MIRAETAWPDGGSEVIHADTWPELFDQMRGYDQYIGLEAHKTEDK